MCRWRSYIRSLIKNSGGYYTMNELTAVKELSEKLLEDYKD